MTDYCEKLIKLEENVVSTPPDDLSTGNDSSAEDQAFPPESANIREQMMLEKFNPEAKQKETFKKMIPYTSEDLQRLSLQQLREALQRLLTASEEESLMLVSQLQLRQQLQEEAEVRSVAIEQLMRRCQRAGAAHWNS